MAFQVGQVCYSSQVEAAQAVASAAVGSLVGQGGSAHSVSVGNVAAESITYVLSPVNGGAPITHVAPFTAQPCNMLQADDALQLVWLIAGVWIGVYCILFIGRALRGETGDSYGNS